MISSEAISKELFKKIRRIQFISTGLASNVFAGAYRSAFKGKGMEFEEVREYQPGDDVRSIDWNVTARMNHLYVKNFREERELTVFLVVDKSASERFGSGSVAKRELIAEIGAVLAFSAIKNNDNVGLILFSDVVEKYLPPSKGTRHILHIIRELLHYQPKQPGSNLKGALAFLGKVQRKSGICFILSDFICPDFSHEAAIIAKRHDLISISITDPCEHAFPELNLVNLRDLETEETSIIDTSSQAVQKQFKDRAAERLQTTQRLMQNIGASFIDIRTDRAYMAALRGFFKLREKRRL